MSLEADPKRATEPEIVDEVIRCTGASTSDPTKNVGKNVTIARTGVGVWQLTFKDYPGSLAGFMYGFQATTASGVKGFTATLGDFDSTGKIISISLWDSTFAAVDLTSTQKLMITLSFKRAGSNV